MESELPWVTQKPDIEDLQVIGENFAQKMK